MGSIFILIRTVTVLFSFSIATAAAQSIVKGTIYDRNEAVLPGFIVRASNKKRIVETTSDSDGEYSLRLPAGVYALSARWGHSGYWYPLRRSNLFIEADRNYEVDLWPSQRILTSSLVVTNYGVTEPITLLRAPQYREYNFSEQKKIKLILQFTKPNRRQSKIQNVILTYDRYTIHADEAEVDDRMRKIILKGTVRFLGDSNMILSNNAILHIERKGPVLSVDGKLYSLTSRR